MVSMLPKKLLTVSTHSRLKAAGIFIYIYILTESSFNTQPPEGGWQTKGSNSSFFSVSTHSRLKAAGSQPIKRLL